MCGIWIFIAKEVYYENIFDDCNKYIKVRGPDRSSHIQNKFFGLSIVFHRLAIEDVTENGDQPFIYEDENRLVYLLCNGEIYNHNQIAEKEKFTNFKSTSDCEKLLKLYLKYSDNNDTEKNSENMKQMCKLLVAEFAFVIIDINKISNTMSIHMASDHLGMRPLFVGETVFGTIITSQLNGIPLCGRSVLVGDVKRLVPREIWSIDNIVPFCDKNLLNIVNKTKYIDFNDITEDTRKTMEKEHKFFIDDNKELCEYLKDVIGDKPKDDTELIKWMIRKLLIDSAYIRSHSDRSSCSLLSGGLDSSLVSGILAKIMKFKDIKLNTFCVGMNGSTDKPYADMVAKHIDSNHTYIESTESNFLDEIENVVAILGTTDVTTVRASVGQYHVAKEISKTPNVVVYCGEIADELCSGYERAKWAPNVEELHKDNIELLNEIHLYDGLRVDRIMSNFGLESRFIFGDINFIKYYLSCPKELRKPKNGIEKNLLRESFIGTNMIPDEVLMRPKEAFSDSVSSNEKSWYITIRNFMEKKYTDLQLELYRIKHNSEHMLPYSKESLYYRCMFYKNYGNNQKYVKTIPHFWVHKWCGNNKEPSARAIQQNIQDSK